MHVITFFYQKKWLYLLLKLFHQNGERRLNIIQVLQKNMCHQFALDFRYLLENDAKFHSNCTVFYCICIMIIYCLISIFELSQLKVEETFKFGEFFKQWVFVSAATQYIGSQRQASIALYPPIMCSLLTAPDFVIYVV